MEFRNESNNRWDNEKKNTSLDEAIKEFINKNIECRKSLQHKMK